MVNVQLHGVVAQRCRARKLHDPAGQRDSALARQLDRRQPIVRQDGHLMRDFRLFVQPQPERCGEPGLMMPSLKTQIHWFTRDSAVAARRHPLRWRPFFHGRLSPRDRPAPASRPADRAKRARTRRQPIAGPCCPPVQADINRLQAKLADFKKLPANPGDLGQFEIEMASSAQSRQSSRMVRQLAAEPRAAAISSMNSPSLEIRRRFPRCLSFLCQMEDSPALDAHHEHGR